MSQVPPTKKLRRSTDGLNQQVCVRECGTGKVVATFSLDDEGYAAADQMVERVNRYVDAAGNGSTP